MNESRIFQEIEKGNRILIAGAGGGFDVFSGLPIYFHLKAMGKEVFLANLSFTSLKGVCGQQISDTAVLVNADARGSVDYFPEKYLCQWFRQQGDDVWVCCFARTGPYYLRQGYEKLCELLDIDTIVLVDGGTDSLMRGDEVGLGTPQEDIASISAVNDLDIDRKLLLCIGFGVDTFHGVNHFQFLDAVAALTKSGHFLGAFSLLDEMEEVQRFKDAYGFVERSMPKMPSIVTTSIISAVEGEYGDHHATSRTHGSKLWINPLMSLYWGFALVGIAERCLYLDQVKDVKTWHELNHAIELFRASHKPIRMWDDIPV